MESSLYLLPPDQLLTHPSGALHGLLERVRQDRTSCVEIAEGLSATLKITDAAAAALIRIAASADRSGLQNSYHNPAHSRDVGLIWANLAVLNNRLADAGRSPLAIWGDSFAVGLIAALGHDLLHDGVGNFVTKPRRRGGDSPNRERVAFRLETIAVDHVVGILADCGVEALIKEQVAACIMATDPIDGHAALEQALEDGGVGPFPRPELNRLSDPSCRIAAALLRDADIMPSAGFTAAEHDRQSTLLGAETGQNLNTPESAEFFFSSTVRGRFLSPSGALFLPQLKALRAVNRLRQLDGAATSLAEAARLLAGQ